MRGAIQTTWEAFFALHLVLLGVLVHRSAGVPRAFGPMLVVAGLGYALNCGAVLILPALQPVAEVVVGITAMLGEVPLFLWLLVKGIAPGRVGSPSPRPGAYDAAA